MGKNPYILVTTSGLFGLAFGVTLALLQAYKL